MATNILDFDIKKRATRYLQPFQIFSSSNTGLNFTKILDIFLEILVQVTKAVYGME